MRAVIFDFDGVLFLSEHIHLSSFEHLAQHHDLDLDSSFLHHMIGHTDRECSEMLSRLWNQKLTPEEILAGKRTIYRKRVIEEAYPVPGSMEWLAYVSKLYPVGIATSSSKGDIAPLLHKWDIEAKIRTIRTVEDVVHPKPAPEVYLRVSQDLGVSPEECLVFEDSVPGITAATRAGMRVVGVTTSHPVEKMPPVWKTVADFSDLQRLQSLIDSLRLD